MSRLEHHSDSAPPSPDKSGTMAGFDDEFTDIVDYILRITYRIWEGKQVGLCNDYYSDDCPVYTLAGITIGAKEVTQNTLSTLASFPDRTLHADNIIWGGDDQNGYHTSHRINTHMTNTGDSDMGKATGKEATIQVIAHCICINNKIVEEWLVRDNYSLAEQLGFDPHTIAKEKAAQELSPRYIEWSEAEMSRLGNEVSHERRPFTGNPQQVPEGFIRHTLHNIWNAKLAGDVRMAYAADATVHASAERELKGHEQITELYTQFLGTLSDLKFSVDYVCQIPATTAAHGIDVAVRWTLMGKHTGHALYGEPTQAPIFILGESHYRISEKGIEEEWTVFDELSVLSQVYRARLYPE